MTSEERRLEESRQRRAHWKRWGPYLSERAWGTVREDYSPYGNAWEYLPHDHARSRAYRWNEDGLAGISDRHQKICFAIALWNGRDPILKERLFGLTGNEGNHGEDVKECYYYLDSTPTHSYMKFLYKYPHSAFPYERLVQENRARGRDAREFELLDTGVFEGGRYFDVFVEYAKASAEDILVRISVANRGPEPAGLDLLPTLWFRNTWSWGKDVTRPVLRSSCPNCIELEEPALGGRRLVLEGNPALLFTENETNPRLFGFENGSRYTKDSFHDYVIHGNRDRINPQPTGTKAAAHYRLSIGAGETATVRLRLSPAAGAAPARSSRAVEDPGSGVEAAGFDAIIGQRRAEADEFYRQVTPAHLSEDAANVMRQAFGGLLWSKQFYHYVVQDWLEGDPGHPPPPAGRRQGRNSQWEHLYNADVISMPDKWEYPWYAAWDLAFHAIPLTLVDPDFAKEQLMLMVREWYMHPNGQ
ncbi:MAG: glucosidase, partial [Acidobacteria bacterium]|nr:glucosidase [Acidobacteriota bacterium]